MTLIICPECGKKVSDKGERCIHCGYPIKEDLAIHTLKCNSEISQRECMDKYQEYNCVINGIVCNVKWIVDKLAEYTDKDLEGLKWLSQGYANLDYETKMQYNKILRKKEGREYAEQIEEINGKIVDSIRDDLNLSQEMAEQFLFEILDNNKAVPKEFNGLSHSEWSEKQREWTKKEKEKIVHCRYCGSTNVKKLRYNFYNFGKEWHCNNCGSDF